MWWGACGVVEGELSRLWFDDGDPSGETGGICELWWYSCVSLCKDVCVFSPFSVKVLPCGEPDPLCWSWPLGLEPLPRNTSAICKGFTVCYKLTWPKERVKAIWISHCTIQFWPLEGETHVYFWFLSISYYSPQLIRVQFAFCFAFLVDATEGTNGWNFLAQNFSVTTTVDEYNSMILEQFRSKNGDKSLWRTFQQCHLLVLGHHNRGVIMVVLEAALSPTLQQQPHCVHLTSATGVVQSCIPTVRLAVYITAILRQKTEQGCQRCDLKRNSVNSVESETKVRTMDIHHLHQIKDAAEKKLKETERLSMYSTSANLW